MLPMLATGATSVPEGPEWVHEVKWDGMRIMAEVRDGTVRLYTRTGAEATDRFPEVVTALRTFPDALLDGEVVALVDGRPSFAVLAERIHARGPAAARLAAHRPVNYLLFDVLRLAGRPLLEEPWQRRRELLEALPPTDSTVLVPDTYPDGQALFQASAAQGLEGVVSKRRDSRYRPGQRSSAWVKVPHRPSVSVLVGGWRWMKERTGTLGSVLVGRPGPSGLVLLGRVGSGLVGHAGQLLLDRLVPLAQDRCPFQPPVPRADAEAAHWVDPVVVIDVYALGTAGRGRLRQPSYHRIRDDLSAADLASELPRSASTSGPSTSAPSSSGPSSDGPSTSGPSGTVGAPVTGRGASHLHRQAPR